MVNVPHTNLFTQVDRTKDPDFFIRFMDEAQKPEGIRASKQLMLERAPLAPGAAVLEVGCGPGTDLLDVAGIVGPSGRLLGVDASEVMIAEARRRTAALGVAVTFEHGDVQALSFGDGTFDVCRAQRLLEHVPDPARALAEMARVTRPGGRVVVFDFDWDTLIIDHPAKATTRTIVLSYSDAITNGWIGRQLPRLLQEQGLNVLPSIPCRSSSTTRCSSSSSAVTSRGFRRTERSPPRRCVGGGRTCKALTSAERCWSASRPSSLSARGNDDWR